MPLDSIPPDARATDDLRCLHELARQLLPLATAAEVARDGLLCIAGISGAGGGALLWRTDERNAFDLLGQFGLGGARVRSRYRLPADGLTALGSAGPLMLDAARRRPVTRRLVEGLEPLATRLGDGWLFSLAGERGPRGVAILGRSLVTGAPPESAALLAELVEVLRLALLGRDAPAARTAGAGSRSAGALPRAARAARGVVRRLAALRRAHPGAAELRGESAAILTLLEQLLQLARTNYTVLLQGDTGTGKELAARLLHRLSSRASGPFETVDCSAIPRELIESELFGHAKGAFTGATREFHGAFERANGGTLLLDEIGDMDPRSQTRLLRVLQEGSVRRLGADRPVPVDVRCVAATNRDLAGLVRAGRFREDLYYRIHVCLLQMPPLCERGDDRLVLYGSFMREHARELGRRPRALTTAARRRLRQEIFPGNVRQVQNVVRQLLVQGAGRGPVTLEELEEVLSRTAAAPRRASSATPGVGAPGPGVPRGEEPEDARRTPGAAARSDEPPATERESPPGAFDAEVQAAAPLVPDVGAWVVEQLRAHRFNLRAAARRLLDLRREGVPREAVPVHDRGALDYYLCGEIARRLVQHDFDLEAAALEIAGGRRLLARVQRRVAAFLVPLATVSSGAPGEMPAAWVRVPEEYEPDLAALVAAVRAGKWQVRPA
jgi:DNA-binding NtrC family response regulator